MFIVRKLRKKEVLTSAKGKAKRVSLCVTSVKIDVRNELILCI